MKAFLVGYFLLLSLPSFSQGQDTIPQPSPFDEGYFFIGPDDLLKFKGYVQTDVYLPFGESPAFPEFLIRRARLAATGYFQEKFRYMLYARFDQGKAQLNEAFVESRHLPFAKIRIGQFKVPFSLANLTSSTQLDVMDRSLIIDNFAPDYDIGIMVFGKFWQEHFDYAVGVFNGRGRNVQENNRAKDIIGHLVIAPFSTLNIQFLESLHLAGSISSGYRHDDLSQGSYQTSIGTPFFSFGDSILQEGRLKRRGVDLDWIRGSTSVKAEYLKAERQNISETEGTTHLIAKGFYATLTQFLTGEQKGRNSAVKPKSNLDPQRGDWGAFELVARYEQLQLSQQILSEGLATGIHDLRSISAGLNWYPNDDIKLVINFQHYFYAQDLRIESILLEGESALMFRFQYQF